MSPSPPLLPAPYRKVSLRLHSACCNADPLPDTTRSGGGFSEIQTPAMILSFPVPTVPVLGLLTTCLFFNRRLPDDQDVSPIEETHPALSQLDIARAHHQRYLEEQQREKENQAPQARSFIPTMRREKRQNQQAATATLRETKSRERLRNLSATKWDDMTGEPTATGRAGQVRPQEFAQEVGQRPQVQLRTPPAQRQDRNVVQSFGDRVRKLRSGGAAKDDVPGRPAISAPVTAPMPLDQRPGWRGASGRTTLVEPVADTTAVPPLNVPRRSSKRVSSSGFRDAAGSPPHQTPTASSHVLAAPNAAAPETPTHPGQQTPSPPPVAQSSQLGAQAYPSPPSGDDARLGPHAPAPAAKAVPDAGSHGGLGQQPTPILAVPDQQKAIRRKPPQAINPLALNKPHHNPHLSYSSSVYSPQQTPVPTEKPPAPYSEDPPVDHFAQAPAEAWIQPPSRFSVTTYATSAAAGSPRPSADSDQPPLPTPPSQFESVMDRRRPVCLGSTSPAINTDQPFKISMSSPYASSSGEASPSPTAARAQLPSQHKGIGPRGRDSGRTDSMLSMSKALPLAPPELMSANDRVAHLNARLEALGNRRININTAIKQMTELMPQDNLMASQAVLHKREAEKRKVEALRAELSDVQREEYELGLKLHRAYKRLDKNAEYEPTTLWVRRVTG